MIDRSFIAEIETCRADSTFRTLGHLAGALQMDLAHLFTLRSKSAMGHTA